MTNSNNKKGMRKHFNQIVNLSSWEGIDMTLRKYTYEKDPNGKVIGKTPVDITINGIIALDKKKFVEMAGKVNDKTIKGVFVWPENHDVSLLPEPEDKIIDSLSGTNHTYLVKELDIAYDIDDPVLIVATLKEMPHGD